MKKMNINKRLIIAFFLFVNQINAQSLEILTDSVYVDSMYFKIYELKIHSNSKHVFDIYKIIQSSFVIAQTPFIGLPEERLKAKVDTMKYYFKTYELNQIRYNFEDYDIFLEKNDILNFSINELTYRSPWEGWRFYLLDLADGNKIQSNLFINPKTVLKKCIVKLKKDGFDLSITLKDLINFQFIVNEYRKITGLDIIFFDSSDTNHGYEYINVHFSWKEIEKCINPSYKKRLTIDP